ncbi:unnamed protein product [Caenorhabditis bovis]|uniref:Receptor ligand binding region domain-containing protein n=1 Tax=Caenorhabditis bovis TaxID=2654633 RepID=A0A8S1EJW6_9PELO|nr:unnamed protein product [Caenorhabditis bovis]
MLLLLLLFLPSFCEILQVGLIAAPDDNSELNMYLGWSEVAGGLGVSWDRIKDLQILPSYESMNLTWVINSCSESESIGAVINYYDAKAHVILGPPCTRRTFLI